MADEPKTTSVFAKSEFWMTLVTCVAGLLLAFGIITPEQNESIATYAPNLIGAIMSLLSSFKFINVQHSAKIEVFRAMCEMAAQRADIASRGNGGSGVTAQSASSVEAEVARLARATGI